jgi:hypothetical protein
MAGANGIKLSGEWAALIAAMDGDNLKARLARALPRAAERVGRDFTKLARGRIRSKDYAPNSPITVILKGSSTPLVDRGDLFQGITYHVVSPYELRLGVMRQRSGAQVVNVGLIVHEGATINVKQHPQVRRKVWATIRDRLGPARMASLNARQRTSVRAAATSLGLTVKAKASRRKVMGYLFATGKIPRSAPAARGSDVWIIPARPFLAGPAQDPGFHRGIVKHYGEAVESALKGL